MHLMQGWSDFPLTKQGREDVRQFGRGLRPIRFRAAWSGNLSRQYETARLALDMSGNGDLPVGVDPDLREDNFGSFEGRDERTTLDQVCAAMGFKDFVTAKATYGRNISVHMQDTFHRLDAQDVLSAGLEEQDRAETTAQVRSRMIAVLTRIAQSAIEEGGGPVLVVSSGIWTTPLSPRSSTGMAVSIWQDPSVPWSTSRQAVRKSSRQNFQARYRSPAGWPLRGSMGLQSGSCNIWRESTHPFRMAGIPVMM